METFGLQVLADESDLVEETREASEAGSRAGGYSGVCSRAEDCVGARDSETFDTMCSSQEGRNHCLRLHAEAHEEYE